jgi:hypothetical protein
VSVCKANSEDCSNLQQVECASYGAMTARGCKIPRPRTTVQ